MEKEKDIIDFIKAHPLSSSKEIYDGINNSISYATVKRRLTILLEKQYIIQQGNAKTSRYSLSPQYSLFYPIDLNQYYSKEVDDRDILPGYNFSLIPDILSKVSLFSKEELDSLNKLQEKFTRNIAQLTPFEYQKEMERLGIDLSWKSSQIEGNTYSLLETERLLKEKETASGKTKEEAIMLLNHKDALDFITQNPDYLEYLSVSKIENIHSILIKELRVDRNIRTRRVGITGTNYRPIDNEFQIREALEQTCELVNNRTNIFEKALFVLMLLSYIQAFNDGNKRVARIVSNAILIANKYCPISFRSVDSIDYKKAMLLFYEQNNISAFKQIFINQFRFAVETYF
ncbi:Fic family protein [Parabacteroides bouchesdurhonensis]|uniref:Fic family protein n=1 Tax=Parabacteroides bouchesdurhonensis TaxID=1936995 RepID=UPI000C858AA7|nr:Fic family protein [Parabacteroides bouchesdurhonensis]